MLLDKTPLPINSRGQTGNTLLMFAADFGRKAIVEELLKRGADATVENTKGDTALAIARKKGHTEVAQVLLNYGATD